jgi:hypothetical protein
MHMPTVRRPRYADIASTLALVVAMGGTAYATATVGTANIKDGAVTTAKLRDTAVTNSKIHAGAVSTGKLVAGAVTHSKIGVDSIDGSNVAVNSLTLSDLLGANATGAISFSLGANSCGNLNLGVNGAQVGQIVVFSFTGDTAIPTSVVFGGNRVTAANTVAARACNVGASAMSVSNLGIHFATFG